MITCSSILLSIFITSMSSIKEASASIETASFKCLKVSCSSALKIWPISNTLSIPLDIIICLYNCGDWPKNASFSKYVIGKSSVPPSVAEATSFGVLISINPFS